MMNSTKTDPKIHDSWLKALQNEFGSSYFNRLKTFLKEEEYRHTIYPPESLIFDAFNKTPFESVKIVILGQDPYHGAQQANGLCFSVSRGIKPPPSLKNIYKELKSDIGIEIPAHGDLGNWATEGVFLLNTTLTVRQSSPGSHQGLGWETFTDAVIRCISDLKSGIVFMLWGRFAQAKAGLIDHHRHLVLTAAHPSPFSAYNGFFGCKHFSKANEYLIKQGKTPVNWQLQ
jgi:uracil-DNA glycosylase